MSEPTFSCTACGRRYPFRPELAGRKVRCKCGQVVQVPLAEAAHAAVGGAPAAAPAYRCLSCGSDLAAGAILCVQCGYNLQTGARIGTEFAGDVPTGGPAPLQPPPGIARPRRDKAADAAEQSDTIKRVIVGAVLIVLIGGLVVGAKFYFQRSRPASNIPMLGQDARAMEMLRDDGPIEAKQFIEGHEARSLGVMWTRRQALDKIARWYDMGAKKVWAFTGVISRHVLIELPDEPEKRKELFQWAKQWDEDHARKPQTDVGQKYLIIDLM